jgi:DNA modification methylase
MNKSKRQRKRRLSAKKKRPPLKGKGSIRTVHKLKTQDAFKFLKTLEPSSADLIISSPPYCMGKVLNSIDRLCVPQR